jgi:hypothetical protein
LDLAGLTDFLDLASAAPTEAVDFFFSTLGLDILFIDLNN